MNDRDPGSWIQTFSGRQFWPTDPRPVDIYIEDIAHALAMQCRFSGHTKSFFSVAQHSVLVSTQCRPSYALLGLMHDAAEAYLVDLPRPLKRYTAWGKEYQKAEKLVWRAICERFGLYRHLARSAYTLLLPGEVEAADQLLLVTEARDLMSPLHPDWHHQWIHGFPAMKQAIDPMPWDVAEKAFLVRFEELGGKYA